MLKPPETALVPFHGHQLLTINDGNSIRVAMKPICEAIGLDWDVNHLRTSRALELMTQLQDEVDDLESERQALCNALCSLVTSDRASWLERKDQAMQILKKQGWLCPTT